MNAEILSIGDEVLKGQTINTNAAEIGRELFLGGFSPRRQTSLPDKEEDLLEGIQEAIQRSPIVVCTGGLGPTCDDCTREVLAKLFDCPMVHRPDVEEEIIQRFGIRDASTKNLATLPEKAITLPNPLGTAPGLLFKTEKGLLFMLPGVPREMKTLLKQEVLPTLSRHYGLQEKSLVEILNFCFLNEVQVDPIVRKVVDENPSLKVGIYPSSGVLRIRLEAPLKDPEEAERQIQQARELILEKFQDRHFISPQGKIEDAIQTLMTSRGLTLATAESCTGGSVAARITSLPGASQYFLGGTVPYSCKMKEKFLNVQKDTLKKHGAVSEACVKEMAEGTLYAFDSHYSLALSGIAGPDGGSPEKPVGTICCAIGVSGKETLTWTFKSHGDRGHIVTRTVNHILFKLHQELTKTTN